jgi:hypothetical protein
MEEQPTSPQQLSEQDERLYGMLVHLGGFIGFVIPLGNIIAPLVIWLTQKDKSSFVDYHGKEALNFQITLMVAYLIAGILVFVVVGIVLLGIIFVLSVIFMVLAAVAANKGEFYKYPFAISFIK